MLMMIKPINMYYWRLVLYGCYWLFTIYVQADILINTNLTTMNTSLNTPISTAMKQHSHNNYESQQCTSRKFNNLAEAIDDVEDLELGVPVNIAFNNRQRKRFLLYLNTTTPLHINFSQIVAREIYFNQTVNIMRSTKSNQRSIILPCALPGQYDIFVQARHRGSIKIEAHTWQYNTDYWPLLLNHTQRITIRTQNRVRKRQMIVKWEKSKFDFHAVHYCLVVSTEHPFNNFCEAVEEYFNAEYHKRSASFCLSVNVMNLVFGRQPEKAKKLDPHITNVICTGSRTQQLIRGLATNYPYYLDVFGVHTKKNNLTFHLASHTIHFNRSHPLILKSNSLNFVKISGSHGVQVFSFKIPLNTNSQQLRYLIMPCGGSEIDAKIIKQRTIIGNERNIYKPTYIEVPQVKQNKRYMIRFKPSNDDEVLRANKIGLAVTTEKLFATLPELPENITVFELRTQCQTAEIAWYSSPDTRTIQYCIIVFNLPHRNRSSYDYTNYCMDFGKRVTEHQQFHSKKCLRKDRNHSFPLLETFTIFNLLPGESYIIYVTINLMNGKILPYQSLTIKLYQRCPDD